MVWCFLGMESLNLLFMIISDSGDSYPVAIRDVKISPDPVVRGGDAIFQIPAVASM